MAVNYTSGELQLSGTVTNSEFYSATSTAGLTKTTDGVYRLDADVRVMNGADVSGLKNIIISLNTKDIYIEDPNIEFNELTFYEAGSRAVEDRSVFRLSGSGDFPKLTDCQFIHNITGNPGGADPRYLTQLQLNGMDRTVFRASEFSEQEIDAVSFGDSGDYSNISGIRVKRFLSASDKDANLIRVIVRDLVQSSGVYSNGGILGVYNGSSIMVSNWSREGLGGTSTNWLDNYNSQLGTHYVHLLGTATDHYMSNAAGIGNRKTTLNITKGGHKHYKFVNGEGAKFGYFDNRSGSVELAKSFPVLTNSEMLDTATTKTIGSDEKVEFITRSMRTYYNGSSWVEQNVNGWKYRVRKYGKQFIEQSFTNSNIEDVEGSKDSFAPINLLEDTSITESNEATVSAYTGISISGTTITLSSGTWTPSKLYDYCRYWLKENIGVDEFARSSSQGVYEYDYKLVIQTTFNIDPETEEIHWTSGAPIYELDIASGGTVTTGSSSIVGGETVYSSGLTFKFLREGTNWNQSHANIRIQGGGTLIQNGGDIEISSPIYVVDSNSTWTTNSGHIKGIGSSENIFIRSWGTSGLSIQGLTFTNCTFGAFRSPNIFNNNRFFNSRFSAVGTSNSGTNTPFTIMNYAPTANTETDFFNEGSSVVSLINTSIGSSLKHRVSDSDPNVAWFVNTGGSKMYKRMKLHTIQSDRSNIENTSVFIRDTNNGSRRSITSAGGTVENLTSDQTYFATTNSNGVTSDIDVLTAVMYFSEDANPTEQIVDQRGNSNDNTDIFTIHMWNYNYLYSSTSAELKGLNDLTVESILLPDVNLTETDSSIVSAYTGVSIDHDAKTITLSSGSWNAKKIYDYVKYNKTLLANIEKPNISTVAVTFSEGVYKSEYSIIVNTPAIFTIDENNGFLEFNSTSPTLGLSGSGTFNFGKTTVVNGITNYTSGNIITFENQGNSWYQEPAYDMNGTVVWNGGDIEIGRPVSTNASISSFIVNKGTFKVKDHAMSSPYEINFNNANFTLNDLTIDGKGTFLVGKPMTINKFTGKGYYGIFPTGDFRGGSTTFLDVRDYEGVGTFNDMILWRRNLTKFINSVNGSDITINGKDTASSVNHTGIAEFWSEVQLNVTDAQNNAQSDVRYYIKDYDDGNRTDTSSLTGSPSDGHYDTGFDYTPDRDYTGIITGGASSTISILYAVMDRSVGGTQITPSTDWSYRSRNGDNTDEFEFYMYQYGKNIVNTVASLKGAGVKTVKGIVTDDINITESDVEIVKLYSGININHTTKTITITTNRTVSEIYDYMSYDKTLASGAPYPTPDKKLATAIGSRIDLADYNVIIDGCDVTDRGSGFSLVQTTGVITLQNSATMDFNFLDANGDALIVIDLPTGYSLDGVYPTENDAKNKTNALGTSVNYKYLTSSDGGDTVYFRIEEDSGSGFGIDDYTLPNTGGVYHSSAIVSTDESLLSTVASLNRDIKNLTEEIRNNQLEKTYFDDFQKRSGYNLATVDEAIDWTVPELGGIGERIPATKKAGAIVPRTGMAISKVKFYVGLEQNIADSAYTDATVKFKIWSYNSSDTLETGVFGNVIWESDNEYDVRTEMTYHSQNSYPSEGKNHKHYYIELDVSSAGILLSETMVFGWEVVTGRALVTRDISGQLNTRYNGTYYYDEVIFGSDATTAGYIKFSPNSRAIAVEITKYDFNAITQYELKAGINNIQDNQLTIEDSPAMFADGRLYVESSDSDITGEYRIASIKEINYINNLSLNSDLNSDDPGGSLQPTISKDTPVYVDKKGQWIICRFGNDFHWTLCKFQSSTKYYISNYAFDPFNFRYVGDLPSLNWYQATGAIDISTIFDGSASDIKVKTLSSYIKDKTDQLTFDNNRVESIGEDDLTETEFEEKVKKGWR